MLDKEKRLRAVKIAMAINDHELVVLCISDYVKSECFHYRLCIYIEFFCNLYILNSALAYKLSLNKGIPLSVLGCG